MNILCLDIGSGTQDALFVMQGLRLENSPKFVLPTPAKAVERRIRSLTAAGRSIHLYGTNMGGGFYHALKAHLEAGLPASATSEAASAVFDDPQRLVAMGATISERLPAGAGAVHLADYEPGFWRSFLGAAGLPEPDVVAACAQDHGFHPGASNRLGRFEMWRSLLGEGGCMAVDLMFTEPDSRLTRLAALQQATGGPVADTGAAALLGALFDPDVARVSEDRGVLVINAGNSHLVAFLVHGGRLYGVFEHHTGMGEPDVVWAQLQRFRAGGIGMEEIFEDGGHGVARVGSPPEGVDFGLACVIGPRREIFAGCDVVFPAPGGDMMLTGAFGMLHGWRMLQEAQRA